MEKYYGIIAAVVVMIAAIIYCKVFVELLLDDPIEKTKEEVDKMTEGYKYSIYWRNGKREIVTGTSITDACRNAGIGAGALEAMDFFMPGSKDTHKWNKETREWDRIISNK